jgi:hypothetical protein
LEDVFECLEDVERLVEMIMLAASSLSFRCALAVARAVLSKRETCFVAALVVRFLGMVCNEDGAVFDTNEVVDSIRRMRERVSVA